MCMYMFKFSFARQATAVKLTGPSMTRRVRYAQNSNRFVQQADVLFVFFSMVSFRANEGYLLHTCCLYSEYAAVSFTRGTRVA